MKSFKEYRKMQPNEYEKDKKWLSNRLLFLWKTCDEDTDKYYSLKLDEEAKHLQSIEDIDEIAFSRGMDAAYDKELHKFKDNYFDLGGG